MHLFSITEINVAICAAEGRTTADEIAARDKQVRNLTQRNPLRPSDRKGRVDLYSLETACAIYATLVVSDYSLPRPVVSGFANWLSGEDHLVALKSTGKGLSRPTVIGSAHERNDANVCIVRGMDGEFGFWASWSEPTSERVATAWKAMQGETSATLTVHVGVLSAALTKNLGA